MSADLASLLARIRAASPAGAAMTADSRRVAPGDVFLAFPGDIHDGRHYILQAIAAGASIVLWEAQGHAWPADRAVANLPLPGLRGLAPQLAAAWYGEPSRQLWMIGVTGTNGKTSISHWLAHALTEAGQRTAILGTLGNGFPGALDPASHTTPDCVTLQSLLARYRREQAWGAAMEVSSHGLDQGRVAGTHFDVAVLTNLSRDHLDYHGDMACYAQAKAKLFGWPGLKWAVLNVDDEFGQSLHARLRGSDVRCLTYGFGAGDVIGSGLRLSAQGLRMAVATPWGASEIESPLLGEFNAYNLLATLATLLASGLPLPEAADLAGRARPVAGRMQTVAGGPRDPTVVVDYAHTPDALEKTLLALRTLTRGRLWCVFGAGGGRDHGKRPLMGGIAAALADHVIVTSDNPRNEDPAQIIAEILAGMPPGQNAIADRAEAIRAAIREARAEDVVLVAGKGHEDYQEAHGVRQYFSDSAVAEAALLERSGHAPE
jgi:UDP-N-acetylmuramoyl-L-alanyl-D-glutamate--2,6-diaminopimelate ligase